MSKRFWLGYRTILLGWSFALMALMAIGGGSGLAQGGIVLVGIVLFAASLAWEWSSRTKAAGPGVFNQSRNHAVALALTGVVIGLPVSAFGLFALPGIFGAMGLAAAEAPSFCTLMAVALGLGTSWVLASLWKYNCAPEWIET